MGDWRLLEAMNQVRFRDINEWIKTSNDAMGLGDALQGYVCECSDATCRERIELTDPEYEAVRGHGTRFALAVNHENPELDRVVALHQRFTTIELLPGAAAVMALGSDPRSSPRV